MKSKEYYQDILARTSDWALPAGRESTPETGLEYVTDLIGRLPVDGGRFLDIGCQAGHLINMAKSRFAQSIGVDIADYSDYWQMIDGAEFFTHDLDSGSLPFPSNHFDCITCIMVLEHVFDVFGTVEEITRLTKPGKYVIIEVPNVAYIRHIVALLKGVVPRTSSQQFPFERSQGWDGQHLHYFTLQELSRLCSQFGLKVVEAKSRGAYQHLRKLCPSLFYASLVLVLQKRDVGPSGDSS